MYARGYQPLCVQNTARGIWSRTWVGFTWFLAVPLSAKFCWGRWESGSIGRAAGQGGGTVKIIVNQTKVHDQIPLPVDSRRVSNRWVPNLIPDCFASHFHVVARPHDLLHVICQVLEPQSPVQDPKGSFSHFLATRRTRTGLAGSINPPGTEQVPHTQLSQSLSRSETEEGKANQPQRKCPKCPGLILQNIPTYLGYFAQKYN